MRGLPENVVMGGDSMKPEISLYGHSLGLFVLTFALGLVDCMSSVTFLAYLANMPPVYAGALLFGETCSGLLPCLFALVQGATTDPQCVPSPDGESSLPSSSHPTSISTTSQSHWAADVLTSPQTSEGWPSASLGTHS